MMMYRRKKDGFQEDVGLQSKDVGVDPQMKKDIDGDPQKEKDINVDPQRKKDVDVESHKKDAHGGLQKKDIHPDKNNVDEKKKDGDDDLHVVDEHTKKDCGDVVMDISTPVKKRTKKRNPIPKVNSEL